MTRREFFQRRIPRYRKDPLLFFKEVTHFEPDPWQREAAVAVSQHRRVAIRSGQGVGKTALEANLMWWFIACFSYPRIVCTAPTMQQLDNVLWAEMAKWLDASPVLQMMFTWTKTRVYMNGYDRRWFAVPRTATKPESLQGFHEDNMLFVVDEASGVADPILDAIGGTLTGANNRLLYCGNPTKATGGFAESFQGDGMDWYCMTVSSRDSPRTSKENIAALEKKYGKNSNVVRVRVDGLPPVADSDVFIPSYIAEKATMNEPLPHDNPVRLSIGCDVARFGDDCTVIAPNIDKHEYMKNGICGDGNFIDNVLGADYITHQIRENLYEIFIANKKIAYTDDGFALVAAGVFAALNRAVELHIIATDPEDDTGVYTVVIPKRADATDEQARNRQMPDIKWSAQLEGAVHSVKVNGTLRVTLNG